MSTKYYRLWRSYFLLLALLSWICYQFVAIHKHVAYILTGNPHTFAGRFNVIGISRTNLHSKTLEYWLDWFNHKTIQQVGNKTFTLLHFDYHSDYDITHDAIHTCSPSQLIYYHQLVEQTLDSLDHIFGATNIDIRTSNISQYVYQYGYINQIIWIYPDHWKNYTQLFIHGLNYHRFRNLISNMTYYLTPITNDKYEYTFSTNELTQDEIEFFQTKLSFSKIITPHSSQSYNSAKSIRFRIHAIPLSELQALIVNSKIFENNKVILDVDLDFFICQSPSETLKDYFNWNQNEMTDMFNTYLSHHQYAPSHIHGEDLQYAMMVLLHQLSHDQSQTKPHQIVHELDESVSKHKDKMKEDIPKITDVIQYAREYHLSPLELRDLLYHLYRFHLEIGDAEFVQPINNYIQTHRHLDSYLFSTSDDNDSFILDHHTLHNKMADTMQMQMNHEANHNDDILYNVSLNEFGQINDFSKHSNYDEMEQWIQHHKLISTEVEDLNEVDEEEFISNLLKNLRRDGSIYKLTPKLLSDIIHNITVEQNYNLSFWSEIIGHSNISIWSPNHVNFIHSLKQQYGIEPVYHDHITYPESLEQLKVSGDYLYSDWQNILNYHAGNSNASWINRYVDGKNATPHLDYDLDEKSTLSAHNLSDLITWDSLDPIQKHFLRKGNHNLLEKFISRLSKHQRKFLDWLIFCHLHGQICENGHSPIDLLKESSEYYYRLKNIEWEDINELPAIISSEKHNDMLQFTSVFHSVKGDNEPSDRQYIPSVDVILNNIDTIQNIMIDNKESIMAIGIEMSYGHIPKDIQQWLDCQVSISLYNALQNESQFVRFQTFEKDKKILNHKCIDELIYLFEK